MAGRGESVVYIYGEPGLRAGRGFFTLCFLVALIPYPQISFHIPVLFIYV